MPEQSDSAVLDSPEALSPRSMNKGGASMAPMQQVTESSPVAAPPPPPPMEISQQPQIAFQPPLPRSPHTPVLPPLPTRSFDDLKISYKPLDVNFCQDFQNYVCQRGKACKYVHCSIPDEIAYKKTLKLPMEVIKQNHRIICVDFAEGECKKFSDCKMWHIQTSNSPLEVDSKKCIPPLPVTNYQYVRPYLLNNSLSESYISNIQYTPTMSMNLISNNQKPLSNMMITEDQQNHSNNNNNNNVMPSTKLWTRPKLYENGATFTGIVTANSKYSPYYYDVPPLPKYRKTSEDHKETQCCTCKEYEKWCGNIEQMVIGTMDKVKEMEQSMGKIARIIEETIPSMRTVLDIIAISTTKKIVRRDNGDVICPSMLQNAFGEPQSFQNYTSSYPSPVCSQNHL